MGVFNWTLLRQFDMIILRFLYGYVAIINCFASTLLKISDTGMLSKLKNLSVFSLGTSMFNWLKKCLETYHYMWKRGKNKVQFYVKDNYYSSIKSIKGVVCCNIKYADTLALILNYQISSTRVKVVVLWSDGRETKFCISRLCGPRQCVGDQLDRRKVNSDRCDQRNVNRDRSDRRKIGRGGRKSSRGDQKLVTTWSKIGRDIVEKLVVAVESLVAAVKKLAPTWSKNWSRRSIK